MMDGINQATVILLVTIIGLVVTILTIIIRIFIRLWRKPVEFTFADAFIVASLIFYFLQSATILWELREGLGSSIESLSETQIANIQKAFYIDNVFCIVSVWLAKTSTACLLFSLSDRSIYRIICGSCIFSMIFTMFITLAIVTLTCNMNAPWIRFSKDGNVCVDMLHRWQAAAVLDLVTEAIILSVSIVMVYPIQISTPLKGLIILAFDQRVLLVIPIVLRLHYLTSTFQMPDTTILATNAILCKEIEIVYGIVAATIPCFPKFVTARETYDVHYAPSKSASEDTNLSLGRKAVLKTKTSLANLRSLTPLFGRGHASDDHGKTIRMVPVNVYDLDNTAAMMDTLPPRDPPRFDMHDFAFASDPQFGYVETRPSNPEPDPDSLPSVRTRQRRYTIEHAEGTLIAVAF